MQEHRVETKEPRRLAEYLPTVFPLLSQGKVYRLAKEKKIRCNGAHCDGAFRVKQGDLLTLYFDSSLLAKAGSSAPWMLARPEICIVYEDSNILIADKPAGLPVSDEKGILPDTLENRVLLCLARRDEWTENRGFRPALCHRLDTGTSGLVMIAKSDACLQAVTDLIRTHRLEKKYLAVTLGRPEPPQGTLRGWLFKDAKRRVVRISEVKRPGSKDVSLQYRTDAVSGRLALLEVRLGTGRTHQIRAQLAAAGWPIVGDSKYGDQAINRELRAKYQLLTAWQLRFPKTDSGPLADLSGKTVTAPAPWFREQMLDHTLK